MVSFSRDSIRTAKKIDGLKQWTIELNSGLNPAKSITSFKTINSSQELENFLNNFGTILKDPQTLTSSVEAFLKGNTAIIVGSSRKQAIILLATYDGKYESSTILQLDKK